MTATLTKLNDRLSIALISHEGLDNPNAAADGLALFDIIVGDDKFQTAEYTKGFATVRSETNNDTYPEVFQAVADALGVNYDSAEFALTVSRLWAVLDAQLNEIADENGCWFEIGADAGPHYGWGWRNEAEAYATCLDGDREINVHTVRPLTDHQASELRLGDGDGFNLADTLDNIRNNAA